MLLARLMQRDKIANIIKGATVQKESPNQPTYNFFLKDHERQTVIDASGIAAIPEGKLADVLIEGESTAE